MDLSIIDKYSKDVGRALSKNSPTILTAFGVAGLISTVVMAVKGTIKAQDILYHEAEFKFQEYESQTGEDRSSYPDDVFTKEEIIQLTWKEYIPTAVMSGLTIACMIGSNHISLRRNAALLSLFTVTESALKEYQAKMAEEVGDKKAEKIRGEIAQDHIDAHPVNEKSIIFTGNGNYLCFDDFSKRYFRSDVEVLRRAQNLFNQRLLREGWLGINEFYYEIGLEPIELGDEFGWIAERNLLEMRFDTKMAKDSNEPCLVIGYTVTPHHI